MYICRYKVLLYYTSHFVCRSKVLCFESQLILNDFDSAAIAGVDQFCEPSVLRLGERERGRGREGEGERGREGERGGKRGREREKVIHYQL